MHAVLYKKDHELIVFLNLIIFLENGNINLSQFKHEFRLSDFL